MISSHIEPAHRLLTTRLAGRLSAQDLAAHLYRVIRDPKFAPNLNGLIVALDPEAVPTPAQFALLRPILKLWLTQRRGARWGVVVPDAHARDRVESWMYELHVTAVTKCFTSEGAALAWLMTDVGTTTAANPRVPSGGNIGQGAPGPQR